MRQLAILLVLAASAVAGPKENVPDDCVLVHSFDFAALKKTEMWGRASGPIAEFMKEVMGLEGLFERMGFDPGKDLVSLTYALGGDIAKEPHLYAIARGTFDAKKLAAALEPAGIKPVERDGMTVFEDPSSEGKITCAFHGAFAVTGDVLLFANPAKGLASLRAAMKEGASRSELAKALEAAPEAHVWCVFLPTKATRDELSKAPEAAPFAALKSGMLTFKLGAQIDVTLKAEAESEELAEQVGTVLQAGLMGLGLQQRAKLECKGATLEGTLSVPFEEAIMMMGITVESSSEPGKSARPVVAEGGPKLKGKGRLQRLALPGQVNMMAASPDDKCVFVDRAQESDVVLDAELRVVGKIEDAHGRMGFALDGTKALWPDGWGGKAVILTIPNLTKTHEIERPPDPFDKAWAVCALPDGKSFVIAWRKEVRLFHMDPPRWGEAGKASLGRPIAGAVDPKTGMLVLSDKNSLEVFDPGTLKSIATLALPGGATFDVVAAGGRAWVGMKDGTILPLDIEAQRILDPVRVADGGGVRLALSGSGGVLVAAAVKFVDRDHHPVRVAVHAVEALALREIAAAEFVSPCALHDVALLEGSRTVLLGGGESFVWRYGEDKSD